MSKDSRGSGAGSGEVVFENCTEPCDVENLVEDLEQGPLSAKVGGQQGGGAKSDPLLAGDGLQRALSTPAEPANLVSIPATRTQSALLGYPNPSKQGDDPTTPHNSQPFSQLLGPFDQPNPALAAAAAARAAARSQQQQRSASLDLLSPSAGQSLFPSLIGGQDRMAVPPTLPVGGLTPEQYQLLINAGLSGGLPSAPATPAVAHADTQLDAAETLWQQMAAAGADDQTLISLAVSLGLITTDGSGQMVLTREVRQPRTPGLRSPAGQGVPGLFSGSVLDAAAAAVAASPGLAALQRSPVGESAPLPRLTHAALASLLGLAQAGVRLPPVSTPGGKPLGSPGPGPSKQHTLYKTELCRGWLESGTCRYGSKCQFAHGPEELRPVPRHPKYKTEVCRSFTATGVCAYGPRCRFIHGCVSAPNALDQQPGSARIPEGLEGLEGVMGFDDLAAPQQAVSMPGVEAEARRRAMLSPNRLLASMTSPTAPPMRQSQGGSASTLTHHNMLAAAAAAAAAANPLTAQDAATMTRLGRLLASPGSGGRTSLDSALSMAMARSALMGNMAAASQSQSDMRRSSMSDMPRSSLDSRGRTSIESSQSQQLEWASQNGVVGQLPPDAFTSPLKPVEMQAHLGMPHQPFMPGIPEGYAMPSMPHEPWSMGANTASPATSASNAQNMASFSFSAPSNSLVGHTSSFSAPSNVQPNAAPPTAVAGGRQVPPEVGLAGGHAAAAGRWLPGGQWWNLVAAAAGKPELVTAASEGMLPAGDAAASAAGLQSAYSSGLYTMGSSLAKPPLPPQQGGLRERGSSPGVITPEKSECGCTHGHNHNHQQADNEQALANMLGL